jgi:hypothetical protein
MKEFILAGPKAAAWEDHAAILPYADFATAQSSQEAVTIIWCFPEVANATTIIRNPTI